jgi:hypothetical protein
MGGIGIWANWPLNAAGCTDDYREIDIRRWKLDGLLVPGKAFECKWLFKGNVIAQISVRVEAGRVLLSYRHKTAGSDWRAEEYWVSLDYTPCNLGGKRPWFLCPARGCGRRVAIRYGGGVFACRHCYGLAYRSQREHETDRAARRANIIKARLGWQLGILNRPGWKPKGLHWKTYRRLCREHDDLQHLLLEDIMLRLGALGKKT